MRETLGAVAFDLDGTLYPDYRLYARLVFFALKEFRLLRAFGRARHTLHREGGAGEEDFYAVQARLMAALLKTGAETVRARTEKLIYRGWEPLFRKIKLYAHIRETLEALRQGGLKLGLLSDFPPALKLEYLGLDGLFDTVLCSERLGCLKPDKRPFEALARSLGEDPGRVLYVGNSVPYDILGARGAGMKAALIRPPFPFGRAKTGGADFVFFDYRTLRKFVLN
jgi:putative hydrolase of the HAD superfamily